MYRNVVLSWHYLRAVNGTGPDEWLERMVKEKTIASVNEKFLKPLNEKEIKNFCFVFVFKLHCLSVSLKIAKLVFSIF